LKKGEGLGRHRTKKTTATTTTNPAASGSGSGPIGLTVTRADFETAERLQLPVDDLWKLRVWDRGQVPIEEEEGIDADEPGPEAGTLYLTSTIDAYVSAVIELYDIQVSPFLTSKNSTNYNYRRTPARTPIPTLEESLLLLS
jgi:hypothetical protein